MSGETASSNGDGCRCELRYLSCIALDSVFAVLFFASFALQFNDSGQIFNWAVFYFLQTLIAVGGGLYITYQKFHSVRRIGLTLSLFLLIWAFVLVIITAKNLVDTGKGGEKEGGDIDGQTDRVAKAYELGGAVLGLVAAAFQTVCFLQPGISVIRNDDEADLV